MKIRAILICILFSASFFTNAWASKTEKLQLKGFEGQFVNYTSQYLTAEDIQIKVKALAQHGHTTLWEYVYDDICDQVTLKIEVQEIDENHFSYTIPAMKLECNKVMFKDVNFDFDITMVIPKIDYYNTAHYYFSNNNSNEQAKRLNQWSFIGLYKVPTLSFSVDAPADINFLTAKLNFTFVGENVSDLTLNESQRRFKSTSSHQRDPATNTFNLEMKHYTTPYVTTIRDYGQNPVIGLNVYFQKDLDRYPKYLVAEFQDVMTLEQLWDVGTIDITIQN